MIIVFVLMIFVVAQLYLSQALTGKDETLAKLSKQISELSDMLSMERGTSQQLKVQLSQLSSALTKSTKERDALASFEKLAAADPANLQFLQDVAQTRQQLGQILVEKGDSRDALKELDSSLGLLENVADTKNPLTPAGYIYVSDLYWLGEAHASLASSGTNPPNKVQQCQLAESFFRKGLAGFRIINEKGSPQYRDPSRVAEIEKEIAQCQRILGGKIASSAH